MNELLAKLDDMAARAGVTIKEHAERMPILCPAHKKALRQISRVDAHGDKHYVWVCPVVGCDAEFSWADDTYSEAAAVMAEEIEEKQREGSRKGGRGSGGRKRQKKRPRRRVFYEFY